MPFIKASFKKLVSVLIAIMTIIILFSNYGLYCAESSGQKHLEYLVYVDFYIRTNGSLVRDFRSLGEVVLEINVEGNKVNLLVRPESFGEFKYYFSRILEESVVIPAGSNITSATDYKRHILDRLRSNETFAREMYSKYLKAVKISNITVSYTLDENNYVVEFPEVGFFPLYSIKPLNPNTIEKMKPVYYGSRIISNGIVGTNIPYTDLNAYLLKLTARHVNVVDDKPSVNSVFYFKMNYLVKGSNIILPVNKTTYVLFESFTPTNKTISLIQSAPNYSLYSQDYWLPLFIGMVVAVAVAGVILWRKRA